MSQVAPMCASDAARLFLGAQGLLRNPLRQADPISVLETLRFLGFVQLDSIQAVARAHDLTFHARLKGYRPEYLEALRKDRLLFEGWTHDASLIPAEWFALWKPRFGSDDARIQNHPWWQSLLGPSCAEICRDVLARIRAEGPLRSADFDHPEKRGPWWGWKPQKAALDYLWRTGKLAVVDRDHFQKVYDLPERALPAVHGLPAPDSGTLRDWLCTTAAERLAVFTPRELAGFWGALDLQTVKEWCDLALKEGRVLPVDVASADGSASQRAFTLAGWELRLEESPEAPDRIRLLAPFDPILRDRARAMRRFNFDYRFEAFTPEDKRQFGYYVLPILEGARLVGRLDPKFHRDRGVLEVKGLWWEPGLRLTKARRVRLSEALERLAEMIGATSVDQLSGDL